MSHKEDEFPIDQELEAPLKTVFYPGFDLDIMAMELVSQARLEGNRATITLRPVAAPPEVREQLKKDIAQAVMQATGASDIELQIPEPAPPKEHEGPRPIPGVKWVVPVASGKGGVGKSTLSVNLAMGLKALGLKVGILDLDLYGPSMPLMLGAERAKPAVAGDKISTISAHGLKVMSVGFLVPKEQALIWRGPLVMKAVRQLLHEVDWAPLDVLVLDLPPGTGDVQITMTQEVPVSGAVVVTTPQDVALADAVKGVDMFKSVGAPVLGIVENMSYFMCPDCDSRHEIFGHGSVEPLCAQLGVPFLGEIPLDPEVRRLADEGRPAAAADDEHAQPYLQLAQRVLEVLEQSGQAQAEVG